MDKSKINIKMCDCPEIQALRKKPSSSWEEHNWEDGDYHLVRDSNNIFIYCSTCEKEFGPWSTMPEWIFLPTQDQLQKMIGGNWSSQLFGLDRFIEESDSELLDLDYVTSIEQLWLAFVMKENYSKRWNGEDWVESS